MQVNMPGIEELILLAATSVKATDAACLPLFRTNEALVMTDHAWLDAFAKNVVVPGLIRNHERDDTKCEPTHNRKGIWARGGAGRRQGPGGVQTGDHDVRKCAQSDL